MKIFMLILTLALLTSCATVDVCLDKDSKQIECPKRERPVREFHERY